MHHRITDDITNVNLKKKQKKNNFIRLLEMFMLYIRIFYINVFL